MKSPYVTVTLLSLLAVPAGPPAEERRRDSDLELGKPGLGDPRPAALAATPGSVTVPSYGPAEPPGGRGNEQGLASAATRSGRSPVRIAVHCHNLTVTNERRKATPRLRLVRRGAFQARKHTMWPLLHWEDYLQGFGTPTGHGYINQPTSARASLRTDHTGRRRDNHYGLSQS